MVALQQALQAWHEGRFEEAERLCQQILAAWPRHPQASLLLTHALLRRGRAAQAEELTAWALTGDPGQPDLLTIRGEVLAMLGRKEEALGCLSEAIDRRLLNPRAHACLSALLAERRDSTARFTVSIIT